MKHIVWFLLAISGSSAAQELVKEVGEVGHHPIAEISGIVKSQTYEDAYWVHNDSGDAPRLFTLTSEGEVIYPGFLRRATVGEEPKDTHWQGITLFMAANQDWEDIALDKGVLYIADVGNNGNARRDLGVYVVREPNPRAITNARPILYWPLEYPDQQSFPAKQWHFDSESLFVDDGVLYFITKHRQPGKIAEWEKGAKLYRLDTQHTDRVNQLTLVGSHPELAIATGSDLSPDGRWLAVIGYTNIWLFERPERGDNWLDQKGYRLPLTFDQTGQVEAIAWKNNDELLFTNEPGGLFTVSKQDILSYQASD